MLVQDLSTPLVPAYHDVNSFEYQRRFFKAHLPGQLTHQYVQPCWPALLPTAGRQQAGAEGAQLCSVAERELSHALLWQILCCFTGAGPVEAVLVLNLRHLAVFLGVTPLPQVIFTYMLTC